MATGEVRMPDAASLPPRSALPRDVDIPVLPGVGITWYDRSGRYRARRVALTLMWAVVLLFIVLIDVGIFTAIHHSSPGTAAILLTIDVLVAIAVFCYFAIHTVRRWNTPALPGRVRMAMRARQGRGSAFLSGLLQIGYLLAVLAIAADLAIITRIRAQPVWVAEVTVSPAPARPRPADGWPVLARMYAPCRPRVGLVEQSPGTEGKLPPHVLVRLDRAVQVLAGWCGADMASDRHGRAGDAGSEAGPLIPMPTAEVSGAFAAVTQLRVAVAQGPSVLLRTLLVATGQGRHWLLEGEQWQRAVPVSADGLTGQVAALLKLPADA